MVQNIEGSLRLRDRNFRFAARHHRKPAMPRVLQAVRGNRAKDRGHHHRDANIRVARDLRAIKSRRRYADDPNRIVVKNDVSADDRGITAEAPLPVAITQYRDGLGAGRAIVIRADQAAEERLHTQRFKVVSGDHFADGAFTLATVTRIEIYAGARQDVCKDSVLVAHGLVHRIGEVFLRPLRTAVRVLDYDEFLRVADRKIAEQNGVHQGEETCVCANAERQRQYSDRREPRTSYEHTRCVTQILRERLEERQAAFVAI